MSTALIKKAEAVGDERVKSLAARIAHESPKLSDLPEKELEKIARLVIVEGLKDDLKRDAKLAKIDLDEEITSFLKSLNSERTRDLYGKAILRLKAWAKARDTSILEINHALADRWIIELKSNGLAPRSVRIIVAGASAFFSWLEREHDSIRNPIRGSKQRPKIINSPKRVFAIPSESEMETIIKAAKDKQLRGAIIVMSKLGLRVGGLPKLTISGEKWKTTSKGKAINGPTKETKAAFLEVRSALEKLRLGLDKPFGGLSESVISDRFRRLTAYLGNGIEIKKPDGTKGMTPHKHLIRENYSVHDLRHYFATRFYSSDAYNAKHELHALKRALRHANVAVTEMYLKSIEIDTD